MDAARTGSVDRMRRGLTVAMTVCTARGVESPRVHATERGLSAEPSESSPCIPSAGKRENRGEDTRCCESATTMSDDRRTPGSCRTSHARSPTVACGPLTKMISKYFCSQSRDHQRWWVVSSSCRKGECESRARLVPLLRDPPLRQAWCQDEHWNGLSAWGALLLLRA